MAEGPDSAHGAIHFSPWGWGFECIWLWMFFLHCSGEKQPLQVGPSTCLSTSDLKYVVLVAEYHCGMGSVSGKL